MRRCPACENCLLARIQNHDSLSVSHTHRNTHICCTSSSSERIRWWLFFILMNFWTCSALAAASWWKTETEGAGCQINWCVRRERGQNGVIKANHPTHTHSHTHLNTKQKKMRVERFWFPNLTCAEILGGAFTQLLCFSGRLCPKTSLNAPFFL